MRSVIFFGLVLIASAIGHGNGYEPSAMLANVALGLFATACLFDVVEFARGLFR
jgi:hypothetical protein